MTETASSLGIQNKTNKIAIKFLKDIESFNPGTPAYELELFPRVQQFFMDMNTLSKKEFAQYIKLQKHLRNTSTIDPEQRQRNIDVYRYLVALVLANHAQSDLLRYFLPENLSTETIPQRSSSEWRVTYWFRFLSYWLGAKLLDRKQFQANRGDLETLLSDNMKAVRGFMRNSKNSFVQLQTDRKFTDSLDFVVQQMIQDPLTANPFNSLSQSQELHGIRENLQAHKKQIDQIQAAQVQENVRLIDEHIELDERENEVETTKLQLDQREALIIQGESDLQQKIENYEPSQISLDERWELLHDSEKLIEDEKKELVTERKKLQEIVPGLKSQLQKEKQYIGHLQNFNAELEDKVASLNTTLLTIAQQKGELQLNNRYLEQEKRELQEENQVLKTRIDPYLEGSAAAQSSNNIHVEVHRHPEEVSSGSVENLSSSQSQPENDDIESGDLGIGNLGKGSGHPDDVTFSSVSPQESSTSGNFDRSAPLKDLNGQNEKLPTAEFPPPPDQAILDQLPSPPYSPIKDQEAGDLLPLPSPPSENPEVIYFPPPPPPMNALQMASVVQNELPTPPPPPPQTAVVNPLPHVSGTPEPSSSGTNTSIHNDRDAFLESIRKGVTLQDPSKRERADNLLPKEKQEDAINLTKVFQDALAKHFAAKHDPDSEEEDNRSISGDDFVDGAAAPTPQFHIKKALSEEEGYGLAGILQQQIHSDIDFHTIKELWDKIKSGIETIGITVHEGLPLPSATSSRSASPVPSETDSEERPLADGIDKSTFKKKLTMLGAFFSKKSNQTPKEESLQEQAKQALKVKA